MNTLLWIVGYAALAYLIVGVIVFLRNCYLDCTTELTPDEEVEYQEIMEDFREYTFLQTAWSWVSAIVVTIVLWPDFVDRS